MAIDYDRQDRLNNTNGAVYYASENDPRDGEEGDDSNFDDEDDDSPAPEHNDQLENIDFDFDEHCEVERREY